MNRETLREKIENCFRESGIRMREGLDLASLDLIVVAVRIEKEFGIKFGLDEISIDQFRSFETITSLVEKHLKDR